MSTIPVSSIGSDSKAFNSASPDSETALADHVRSFVAHVNDEIYDEALCRNLEDLGEVSVQVMFHWLSPSPSELNKFNDVIEYDKLGDGQLKTLFLYIQHFASWLRADLSAVYADLALKHLDQPDLALATVLKKYCLYLLQNNFKTFLDQSLSKYFKFPQSKRLVKFCSIFFFIFFLFFLSLVLSFILFLYASCIKFY